jgi:hypothetical protein
MAIPSTIEADCKQDGYISTTLTDRLNQNAGVKLYSNINILLE